EASGPGRHLQAVKKAISSPLLENADIRGDKGFIVHFSAEENLTLLEQGEVMNLIRQYASNDSIIMFGHTYDSSLAGTFKVTVIATGFSPEKANVFNVRRPLPAEPVAPVTKPSAADVFASFEKVRSPQPEDEMMIPAFLRRGKNRS
ncbi:MAG: cell division protein FtsZ, partial [Elusimicrobiaceae bacterium]|nr:cell division protein FtsZ [Elusimicrobiaceae bacterium]